MSVDGEAGIEDPADHPLDDVDQPAEEHTVADSTLPESLTGNDALSSEEFSEALDSSSLEPAGAEVTEDEELQVDIGDAPDPTFHENTARNQEDLEDERVETEGSGFEMEQNLDMSTSVDAGVVDDGASEPYSPDLETRELIAGATQDFLQDSATSGIEIEPEDDFEAKEAALREEV